MKKSFLAIIIIISFLNISHSQEITKGKKILITEKITLETLPDKIDNLNIWIPLPQDDTSQSISSLEIQSNISNRITFEPQYNNKILYLKSNNARGMRRIDIAISFVVDKKEALPGINISPKENSSLERFLKADNRVPVNKNIKKLAKKISIHRKTDIERVRAIYDYLIDNLTYSKDNPNICGVGDSLITLKYKKGICSDYHSLFISLVRSIGIPAKFEIGLRIPKDKEEGVIEGYHCWAEFYLKDKGWIPVDISEADKHPEFRDYYFGNLDADRVLFTVGRDIILNPRQSEEPLNFFVFPYAELNQKKFTGIKKEVEFRVFKEQKGEVKNSKRNTLILASK